MADTAQDPTPLVVKTPHNVTSRVQLQDQGMFGEVVDHGSCQPQLQAERSIEIRFELGDAVFSSLGGLGMG